MVHVVAVTERRATCGRGVVERPWREGVAMTIADHGAPAVARRLVTTTAGAVATGDTRMGCGRTVAGVLGYPCAQHRHGRDLRSRSLRALGCGLDRPTVRGLVVENDRGARVELVP